MDGIDEEGTYTVRNNLKAGTTFLSVSGKTLTYADGTLTQAFLACGGQSLGNGMAEQYFWHDFAPEVALPGTESKPWPAPKPVGPPKSLIEPDPATDVWTFSYTINAPNNTLGAAQGQFSVPRRMNSVVELRYQIDSVNGAAWYAIALWTFLPDEHLPAGITPDPVLTQIGDTPAVHVS